ncbi:MAG TPA: (2Fe-2S) ferredoxin domain-containing protein [Pyrinomonadaceae bacterium]|nr:(2Fe-2S) ferredoxin domain-containing protein [Pyrinomonadaceae bacterium]
MAGLKKIRRHVLVCEHKDCLKRGGKESLRELKHALKEAGARERVLITKVDCLDQCDDGPVMVVYPEGVWYGEVDGHCAREIAETLARGEVAGRCRILRDMRGDGDAGREE